MNLASSLFGIDTRSLALFRIGLALILFADLVIRMQDIGAHYSDEGLLPRADLIAQYLDSWHLSLHLINGTWEFQLILFILQLVFAFSLLLGFHTRFCTVASWILLISLQTRNPLINHGGDAVFRLLLFWGMFLPLGACWSLDSKGNNQPYQVISGATFAILLQVCFIYWFSAVLKTDASWRQDGTAVWYVLSNDIFATSFGRYLLNYPSLLPLMTFSTMFLEFFGPFFAFSPILTGPLRFITATAFILFHLALGLTLTLGIFPYVCIAAWLAFLPSWFWDKILSTKSKVLPCKQNWPANCLSAVLLVYIFLGNMRTVDLLSLPPEYNALGSIMRIDQYWNMFAPYPIREGGWFAIPAKLRNGQEIDLYNEKPISWELPELCSACYKNDRWRSFMLNLLFDKNNAVNLSNYAKVLMRQWNEKHPYEENLVEFEIVFMSKLNDAKKTAKPHEKFVLWKQIAS